MTPEERQLLGALADRVKNIPDQQKDPEADQFLRQLTLERPDTAYILAQTVIMQDFALRTAQGQIQDLQRELSDGPPSQQGSGSFLGGLFGGGSPQQPTPASGSVPRVNPWGSPTGQTPPPGYGPPPYGYGPSTGPTMQPSQTGGFLRSAASTAAGVAGGALLFDGIRSLFSGHQGGGLMGDLSGVSPHGSLSETAVPHDGGGDSNRLQEADFDRSDDGGYNDDSGDSNDSSDYA